MKKIMILSLAVLAACHNWGPHMVTLNVSEGLILKSTKGDVVEFPSESVVPVSAFYSGSKKTLTLSRTGLDGKKQNFNFKKISIDEGANSLSGDQLSTGQNVGVTISRNLISEEVREEEYWRSCTYYESRPETICYPRERGAYHDCRTHWVQVPYPGREKVRERITDRAFGIRGQLFQSIGTLAQVSGNYNESSSTFTHLSSCR